MSGEQRQHRTRLTGAALDHAELWPQERELLSEGSSSAGHSINSAGVLKISRILTAIWAQSVHTKRNETIVTFLIPEVGTIFLLQY